jgi:hypothetical protein
MSRLGSEPTTPVFEWAKMIHAWEGAANVIGDMCLIVRYNISFLAT